MRRGDGLLVLLIAVLLVLLAAGLFYGWPKYRVWQRGMAGQAELREAEQNRQIRVEEARAELEAAEMLAQAEVARARGVKEANDIIAEGLGGPEGYLRYLFIQSLEQAERSGSQIIYVPTEAMMPILEAGRFSAGQ